MNDPLWHVRLSDGHPRYQQVSLRRRPGYPNHEVVIVDAQKLIQYSAQDFRAGYVIGPVGTWDPRKRQGLFEFLAPPGPRERHVEMPIVSFNEVTVYERESYLWLFSHIRSRQVQYVGYTNGRHRARYLADAGARDIPVMCHKDEVHVLRAHCTSAGMA
ncbi:plasmid fertility inhibition factor family protein [Thauera mechernichensis]